MEQGLLRNVRQKMQVSVHYKLMINAVLLSGALALSVIYFLSISPKMDELANVQQRVDEANTVRLMLEQKTKPPTVADQKIRDALTQTPIGEGWEDFFSDLEKIMQKVGVTVQQFDLNMDTKRLNELINNDAALQGEVKFVEHPFSLTVQGSYPELTTFLEHFQAMKRVVTIDQWEISIVPEQLDASGTSQLLRMNVSARIYQASAYTEIFKDITPPKIIPSETRDDPTWSDQQFFDQISVDEGVMVP